MQTATVLGLFLAFGAAANGDVSVAGDVNPADPLSWNDSTVLTVGDHAPGTLWIDQADTVETLAVYCGHQVDSTGEISVSGDGSHLWAESLILGFDHDTQASVSILDRGRIDLSDYCSIAEGRDSSAQFHVAGDGSLLRCRVLNVGYFGQGDLFVLDGGRVEVAEETWIARGDVGSGTIHLDGGVLETGSLIGAPSQLQGQGLVTTGGLVGDLDVAIASPRDFTQTFTFDDGLGKGIALTLNLRDGSVMGAGYVSSGSLSIGGGMNVISSRGEIALGQGSTGLVRVAGEGSTWRVDGPLTIGTRGSATLEIADGGRVSSEGVCWVGNGFFTRNTITIDSPGSCLAVADVLLASSGTATAHFSITDGGGLSCETLFLQGDFLTPSELLVSGADSLVEVSGHCYVGYHADGRMTVQDGGRVTVNGQLAVGGRQGGSSIRLATGGKLAMRGRFDESLAEFLVHVVGGQNVHYATGDGNWTPITQGRRGSDFHLLYEAESAADGWTVLVVSPKKGDINLDHRVDMSDFNILRAFYGQDDAQWNQGDLNHDGAVDIIDFSLFKQGYFADNP